VSILARAITAGAVLTVVKAPTIDLSVLGDAITTWVATKVTLPKPTTTTPAVTSIGTVAWTPPTAASPASTPATGVDVKRLFTIIGMVAVMIGEGGE
jgi:hypothetical protein